jgi:hypothetical protein
MNALNQITLQSVDLYFFPPAITDKAEYLDLSDPLNLAQFVILFRSHCNTFANYRGIVDVCLQHEFEAVFGIYLVTWDNGGYKHM